MPIRPFSQKHFRSNEVTSEAEHQHAPTGSLVAHIDGGARGNPEPAGYGVVIQDESDGRWRN